MNARDSSRIVCAGVGNTSIRIGVFSRESINGSSGLPEPLAHHSFSIADSIASTSLDTIFRDADWFAASVNGPSAKRLQECAEHQHAATSFQIMSNRQFAIPHRIKSIDQVGSDRLAAAVASNRCRRSDRPIVFIDAGTALTVNSISAEGIFLGGAILPGLEASLRALAGQTEQLPLIELNLNLSEGGPIPIGHDTEMAIRAGVYWGLVGAARELIHQATESLQSRPQILVTGGFGPWLARELGQGAEYVEHLVLGGIAITAGGQSG